MLAWEDSCEHIRSIVDAFSALVFAVNAASPNQRARVDAALATIQRDVSRVIEDVLSRKAEPIADEGQRRSLLKESQLFVESFEAAVASTIARLECCGTVTESTVDDLLKSSAGLPAALAHCLDHAVEALAQLDANKPQFRADADRLLRHKYRDTVVPQRLRRAPPSGASSDCLQALEPG